MTLLKFCFLILAFHKPVILTVDKPDTLKQKTTASHHIRKKIIKKNSLAYFNWQIAIQRAHKKYYSDCVFTNQYSIAQRLNRYPFKRAVKILAVSYDGTAEPNRELYVGDTVKRDTTPTKGLHFKDDTLVTKTIFEIKELSQKNIIELTRIIFNTANKIADGFPDPGRNCFNPRNAFVFYDEKGKIYDYIEICFDCLNFESKSKKINLGAGCNQKFDLVKNFFVKLGIQYGTMKKGSFVP